MQATMKIKEEKLLQFQELVKAFGLYFKGKGKPYIYNGMATVTVDADHLPMEKCNEFFATWYRMNTDIREIPKQTKLQKFSKKLKDWFV